MSELENHDIEEYVEAEPEAAVIESEPEAPAASTAPVQTKPLRRTPSPGGQAVSGAGVDEVHACQCIVKNVHSKKSLSIHHVQRRLGELGFIEAIGDKDGWYGDGTISAVRLYQEANGLEGDGIVNAATLEHLFADDPNVAVAC